MTKAEHEFKILEDNSSLDMEKVPIVLEFKDEIIALVSKFNQSGQSGG